MRHLDTRWTTWETVACLLVGCLWMLALLKLVGVL